MSFRDVDATEGNGVLTCHVPSGASANPWFNFHLPPSPMLLIRHSTAGPEASFPNWGSNITRIVSGMFKRVEWN
jgi:hypothetical protein